MYQQCGKINANYPDSLISSRDRKESLISFDIMHIHDFPRPKTSKSRLFSAPYRPTKYEKNTWKSKLSHNDGHSIACDPSKPLGDGQFDPAQTVSSGHSGSRLAMWKTWKQRLNVTKTANCHPRLLNNLNPVMELTWCDSIQVTIPMAQNSMSAPRYQYDQDA